MAEIKPPQQFDKPIAWITETIEIDRQLSSRVIRQGMTRTEIKEYFPRPPRGGNENTDYDRKGLIKAVIYEAYREVVNNGAERERGNIRSFWYERLMYTLVRIMGEPGHEDNINSINASINQAWGELVEGGYVTYKRLNLYSEKERGYNIRVVPDSPYPTTVVIVEKESLYDSLAPLADTYEISFAALGGQASRAAALDYLDQLKAQGVDLSQDFLVISFCDYDPEGWVIPQEFISHLALDVTGEIKLVRAGMIREQISQSTIDVTASEYPIRNKRGELNQAKLTKYANFEAETEGIYIPSQDNPTELVPARIEIDILPTDYILRLIVESLAQHLDGFEYQVREFKESLKFQYDEAMNKVSGYIRDFVVELYDDYYDAIRKERDRLNQEIAERTQEENRLIQELRREIDKLDQAKQAKTDDLLHKKEILEELKEDISSTIHSRYREIQEDTDYPEVDDLIDDIEENGGWKDWAQHLSIKIVSTDDVRKAGFFLKHFQPTPDYNAQVNIRNWLVDALDPDYYIDDVQYSHGPEDLIKYWYEKEGLDP